MEQSDVFFSSEQIRAGHRLKAERHDENTDAGESSGNSSSPPEILLPPTAEDKDAVAPLTGGWVLLTLFLFCFVFFTFFQGRRVVRFSARNVVVSDF